VTAGVGGEERAEAVGGEGEDVIEGALVVVADAQVLDDVVAGEERVEVLEHGAVVVHHGGLDVLEVAGQLVEAGVESGADGVEEVGVVAERGLGWGKAAVRVGVGVW